MPDKIIIEEEILKDIAQSIREGTKTEEKIVPSNFSKYIRKINNELDNLKKANQDLIDNPNIKTCSIELLPTLDVYLHGYSVTTYSNGKFYCNFITPRIKECYGKLFIENVVCGSILVLNISAKKLPIRFKGAECLESSEDFYTYYFKIEEDTILSIFN